MGARHRKRALGGRSFRGRRGGRGAASCYYSNPSPRSGQAPRDLRSLQARAVEIAAHTRDSGRQSKFRQVAAFLRLWIERRGPWEDV